VGSVKFEGEVEYFAPFIKVEGKKGAALIFCDDERKVSSRELDLAKRILDLLEEE